MPAAYERPITGHAGAPKRARKIDDGGVDLDGIRPDDRRNIEDAGSALPPEDREGHRSHTLSPPPANQTARLRAETR